MPFLIAFWKPIAGILLIVAIVATLGWAKNSYDEGKRDEGRTEVQGKWDADRTARIKRTTEITLELSGKLMAAKDAAAKREGEVNARFQTLAATVNRIPAGRTVGVSGVAAGVFDDASRAANSARPGAGREARADPVPIPAEARYDEREFAGWIVAAGAAYSDAYGLWASCRAREDQYLTAMTKGVTP